MNISTRLVKAIAELENAAAVLEKLFAIDRQWTEGQHRRDAKGRFTSGGGSGRNAKARPRESRTKPVPDPVVKAGSKSRGKSEKVAKPTVFEYGNTHGSNDFSRGKFTKKQIKEHLKHMKDVGVDKPSDYERKARELGSKPVGGDIAGGRDRNGQIVRYNKKTGELFVGNPQTKHFVTYFKVKGGDLRSAAQYMKRHYPDIDLKGKT